MGTAQEPPSLPPPTGKRLFCLIQGASDSWECVLNKREDFRAAYDNFSIDKVINYDDKKVEELLSNEKIIRNRLKVMASINNSKIFKEIQEEFGSFDNYLKNFTKGKVFYEVGLCPPSAHDRQNPWN